MLIYRDGSYQINTKFPNINYLQDTNLKQPDWVIDDNSEFAAKIMATPYWEPIVDNDGNLIDIMPTEPPVTPEEQISELKNQLVDIDMQTVRPLRAITAGTATEEDREKLAELEAQAEKLRTEIKTIYKITEG